ncbi:MAG: biopolymer transporter ExbD, partial [Bacteroidota bacterium]|nr:biopolymer transporter ExbD [Bacteroidota bacterium]
TMEISMPSKDKVKEEEQTKVKASNAITIMLGKNDKVYYYFGTPDTAKVKITTFAPKGGIRDILLKRNMDVAKQIFELKAKKANKQITQDQFTAESAKIRDNKAAPTVMIKATDESNYNNLVNILDEMNICSIAKYAIVPIEGRDKEMIKKKDPDSGLK